jgi:hypothetical protein
MVIKHALNNKAAFSFYSFRAKLPLLVTYSAIAIVRTATLAFLPITLLLAFTPALLTQNRPKPEVTFGWFPHLTDKSYLGRL